MTGSLVVRDGDLDADRQLALHSFARHLNPHYDDARFDWVYRQNPHGQGRLWIAANPGGVVGIAGAFPRRMSVAGREQHAWVLGDFCVGDGHRSLGPALALQRACLAAVTADGAKFCYDFPSPGMMAVYRRLGIKPLGRMIRYVRPLGVESHLRRLVGSTIVTQPLSALARTVLAPPRRRPASVSGVEISLEDKPFGDEFTDLYQRCAAEQGVMVARSAEYLNWRYRANPLYRHEVLTARERGRLVGYAIFIENSPVMTLVDMMAGETDAVVEALIRSALALAWQRRLDAVCFSVLESSTWITDLKSAGFREREPSPVVVYMSSGVCPTVGDERAWHLLLGDRDS